MSIERLYKLRVECSSKKCNAVVIREVAAEKEMREYITSMGWKIAPTSFIPTAMPGLEECDAYDCFCPDCGKEKGL